MNVLAIGAHPDDIELSCAGTLARYAQEGHLVSMAIFTCGNMGDLEIAPMELAEIRKAESEESAAILAPRCCGRPSRMNWCFRMSVSAK